jgi:catechol 2,3-dioxygenase-like lactoylglutathione lyase family enzyme
MRLSIALSVLVLCASSVPAIAQQPIIAGPGIEVGLIVSDLPQSVRFYGTVLGLKPVAARAGILPGERAAFQAGASVINLHRILEMPRSSPRGVMSVDGFRLLTILVVGAADVTARFEAAGLPRPSFSRLASFNVAFVDDPDGNTIELVALDTAPDPSEVTGFQVGLTVSDAERARQFYGDVLGLAERPAMQLPEAMASNTLQYMYRASTAMVKFWAPPTRRSRIATDIAGARGIRYLLLHVNDAAATRRVLESKGLALRTQDSHRLSLTDPDGNAVELVELE